MPIAELTRNAVDVLPEGELETKLTLGRPLRVKLGIDVTSPDIHVGRGIPLQRMRAFQDEGHVGVLIIGDYTTRIGDPSGRSSERPILSDEEIDANAQRYLEQAKIILRDDPELLEVRFNGEWLSKLVVRRRRPPRPDVTVARMLERDDFDKAVHAPASRSRSPSSSIRSCRRTTPSRSRRTSSSAAPTSSTTSSPAARCMEAYGLEPQVVLTTPLLLSLGRREDELVGRQQHRRSRSRRRRCSAGRCASPTRSSRSGGRSSPSSRCRQAIRCEAKLELARFIVARSHGEDAARAAEEHFTRVVRDTARRPRTCRSTRCRRAIRSICRRFWPMRSVFRRARRGA